MPHMIGLEPTNHRQRSPTSVSSVLLALVAVFCAIADSLHIWREMARQRRQLAELDDRMLADIGVSRSEARHESAKPFWHH